MQGAALKGRMWRCDDTMPAIQLVPSSGDVVNVTAECATISGVLARLEACDGDIPPIAVPFSAEHIRTWAADSPEVVSSFERALAVVKVGDTDRGLRTCLHAPHLEAVEQ